MLPLQFLLLQDQVSLLAGYLVGHSLRGLVSDEAHPPPLRQRLLVALQGVFQFVRVTDQRHVLQGLELLSILLPRQLRVVQRSDQLLHRVLTIQELTQLALIETIPYW